MACQWYQGTDNIWHQGEYLYNSGNLNFYRPCFAGLPQDQAIAVGLALVILLTFSLCFAFGVFSNNSQAELPPAPDPLDESKQTNQARQSRRKYAPHAQSIEWDVLLNHETVELYIRVSQEEAKIIREFGLDDIEYENGAAYSPEELQEISDRYIEEEAKVADPYKRSILHLAHQESLERLKQLKLVVRLGDYLGDYPYVRIFRTRLAATAYSDFLKRTVLPAVKKELELRKADAEWQTV